MAALEILRLSSCAQDDRWVVQDDKKTKRSCIMREQAFNSVREHREELQADLVIYRAKEH